MTHIDSTAWDGRDPQDDMDARMKRRDPHAHEDMSAKDWPLLLILIIPALALFAAGFSLGRIWA